MTKEELQEHLVKGLTISEIADIYDCSNQWIIHNLKKYSLKSNCKAYAYKRREITREKLLAVSNLPKLEACKKLGITVKTYHVYCEKYNINLPKKKIEVDIDKIAEMYFNQRLPLSTIAKELGITGMTVRKKLMDNGYTLRSVAESKRKVKK